MSDSPDPPAPAAPSPRRARRCNADYRWTVPKAMAFLKALAQSGQVAEAARAVGMSRQAAYDLRKRLAGGPLGDGFELARREGLRARAARSVSRWEGLPLAAIAGPRQADTGPAQADGDRPQAYAFARKPTQSAPS